MSLPKNALYTNKINSSYARNYQSVIQPQNGDATFNDTIIFNIPTGNNLVMSGADTVLKFDLTIRAGDNANGNVNNSVFFNKAGAYGCFQRMRILHGGTMLSDIDNYANLIDMLVVSQQSTDILGAKYKILAGTDVRGGSNLGAIGANAEPTFSFCIPLVSILSLTHNYVPLFAMSGSPLRIELQVVNNVNQIAKSFVAIRPPITKSLITRCELVCNMIEMSDTGMTIVKNAVGSGPLQWVVSDYRNYGNNVTLGTAETTVSVPVPAKFNSLNSLFFSFRLNASGALNTIHANESCNFGLLEYYLRIGSRTLPIKPPNTRPEIFSELLRAFGTVSDINHECAIDLEQYNAVIPVPITAGIVAANPQVPQNTGAFYVGVDLESYSNTSMDMVYTGTNTSNDDIFFTPKFAGQAANPGALSVRIDAYALFDQLVLIQNGTCTINN
jgi:hypothetical protein